MEHANLLIDELRRLGGDVASLWKEAGINIPFPTARRGRLAEIPAAEFVRFYRGAIGELERLCCAVEGRRPTGKAMMDMLCYSTINCKNLREVVARIVEFNALMEERGSRIEIQEFKDTARFLLEVPERGRNTAAFMLDSAGLYFYYQLFSWMIGTRIELLEVSFAHGIPSKPMPSMEYFGVAASFNRPVNSLSFTAQYLDQPVIRTYDQLLDIIDYFPFDMQFRAGFGQINRPALSDQLRLLFLDSIQRRNMMPSLITVAQLLHVSQATLRRHLSTEKTSFAELRAQCLREVAESLLKYSPNSVDNIAAHLGFSDGRAFRRAFRDWTGASPATFRASEKDEVNSGRSK
jgi:AraC-like DNA-binding protein